MPFSPTRNALSRSKFIDLQKSTRLLFRGPSGGREWPRRRMIHPRPDATLVRLTYNMRPNGHHWPAACLVGRDVPEGDTPPGAEHLRQRISGSSRRPGPREKPAPIVAVVICAGTRPETLSSHPRQLNGADKSVSRSFVSRLGKTEESPPSSQACQSPQSEQICAGTDCYLGNIG
jgi:hypothetical protein